MNPKRFLYVGLLIAALIASACGPKAAPEPTATPLRPTDTPTAITEVLTPAVSEVPMGFTEEGAPYRGNPNAPVTLVEHSEFQ